MNNQTEIPQQIDGWTPVAKLGAGSFGEAFKVNGDQETVAVLKLMRGDAEGSAAARFENEAWALQQIDHPGIPRFLDKGVYEGRPYIVMSLAKGKTLKTRLDDHLLQKKYVGQVEWLDIVIGLLSAIHALHEKNICHRDVKHDNVIVSDNIKPSYAYRLRNVQGT